VFYENTPHATLLLGIEDVTERRALEREREELLRQKDALLREKDMLLEELQHRVANSLQIIAAIILMKSRTVASEETRLHLQDAHNRVMSVAAVQQHLHVAGTAGTIEMAPYLTKLCESLTTSMISNDRPIKLKVISDGGSVNSRDAVSLGLVVTELVLNAVKHAFLNDRIDHRITVAYDVVANWRLRLQTMGWASRPAILLKQKPGSVPALSKHSHISSMPGSRSRAVPRERPSQSAMPFLQRCLKPLGRRRTFCGRHFAGMPDHKFRIVGLAVETAAGREFVRLRRGPSRNDDDANVRPPVIHRSGERQAVYHSREVHAREEHLHFGTRIEDLQHLITVNGLDRSDTGVDEQSDSRNAHQRFVFDD
jgi:two-component sensor histidine kinase